MWAPIWQALVEANTASGHPQPRLRLCEMWAIMRICRFRSATITQDRKENLKKKIKPSDALDEESIEEAVACLIATTDETVENECWFGSKRSSYRAQRATLTVREKVNKVEEFSNYLMSPLRKRYDVFFRSSTVTFKAIRCWLN